MPLPIHAEELLATMDAKTQIKTLILALMETSIDPVVWLDLHAVVNTCDLKIMELARRAKR